MLTMRCCWSLTPRCDPTAGPAWAPPAPGGRFWFEVAIGGRRRGYALKPGVFPDDFVAAIGRHQEGRAAFPALAEMEIETGDDGAGAGVGCRGDRRG